MSAFNDPGRSYRAPRSPQTLSVTVEERPLFAPATGLLSYRVELVYTDEGNWTWERFDLLEEVQAPGQRLSYRAVDLDGYRFDRPVIAAGRRALSLADVSHPDVMAIGEDAIIADMRRLDAEAAERRAA